MSGNITFICTLLETGNKREPEALAFLPVFEAHTNKFYICPQCMYIVYLFYHAILDSFVTQVSDTGSWDPLFRVTRFVFYREFLQLVRLLLLIYRHFVCEGLQFPPTLIRMHVLQ